MQCDIDELRPVRECECMHQMICYWFFKESEECCLIESKKEALPVFGEIHFYGEYFYFCVVFFSSELFVLWCGYDVA